MTPPRLALRTRTIATAVLLGVLAVAPSAAAHDFWLQPSAYRVAPQAIIPITLQVGHGPSRQRSPIPVRRITRFDAIGPRGSTNERTQLRLGGASNDGTLQFRDSGIYVLVLETDDQAEVRLPAIRFNDYLQTEGLTPAIQDRARRQRTDTDGAENYSRCAKAIVEIGNGRSQSANAVTRPLGLPLEIVPEVNPYAEPQAANLPVRVLYQGRPLAGALVKLTNLQNDATPFEMHRTDNAGRAVFAMPHTGAWLLNVIWTRVQPATAETDFETTFSSLAFGFTSN